MRSILKCQICGKYTMKESCACGGTPVTPKPAKYSIDDKYGAYRRKAKLEDFKNRGLL